MPLRVGVEYLASHDTFRAAETTSLLTATRAASRQQQHPERDTISVTALRPPSVRSSRAGSDQPEHAEDCVWLYDKAELAAIENSAERLTLTFINDLIGEDRRRMQRELRTPILTNRMRYTMRPAQLLPFDDQEIEEEASFVNDVAPGLIRRPLRNLLKTLTFIDDFEVAFREFKDDHIPLSSAFNKRTGRRTGWGRVSLRLRMSDGSDPAEFAYYNWGMRVASSKESGRLQYRFHLTDDITGSVRYRFNYESHDSAIRADLRYHIDEQTSATLLLGDRLDFLAGPTAYSFLNSPLDGTPGVLFYVEHLF